MLNTMCRWLFVIAFVVSTTSLAHAQTLKLKVSTVAGGALMQSPSQPRVAPSQSLTVYAT